MKRAAEPEAPALRTTPAVASAARPVASAALAVTAGNALGLALARSPATGPVATGWLALLAAALVGACAARRVRPAATRAASGWLSVLLVVLAAWRASALAATPPGPVMDSSGPRTEVAEGLARVAESGPVRASALDRADEPGTPARALQAGARTRARVAGVRVDGDGLLALDGERVRVLPGEPPIPPPRAPLPPDALTLGRDPGEPVNEVLADQVVRLAPGPDRAAPDRWARWRAEGVERLAALPSPAAAALAPAVLLGERSGVDAKLDDLFVRTGTRHLLAVSGTHVALLALLASLPLRAGAHLWGRGGRAVGLVVALLLCAYVPLAGQGPPVKRAALALALARLAPLLPAGDSGRAPGSRRRGANRVDGEEGRRVRRGRRADAASLLGLALLLEGLADPASVAGIGVQLSFAATFGLLVFARPAARSVLALAGLEGRLGPRRSGRPPGWVALVLARAARAAALALGASLAATLATLPLVWIHFGECSPPGLLLTPLALPLVGLLLGASALHALSWLPPALTGAAAALPAELLVGLLEWGDTWPASPAPLPARPDLALAAVALVTLVAGWRAREGGGAGWLRAAALAWAAVLVPWRPAPAGLELALLDVGHGTALVARAPGAGTLVLDAGSRDRRGVARRALGPWLARCEAVRPTVVLTHDDRDHASALDWLVERYPPGRWLGALPAPLAERIPHRCERLDLDTGAASLGGAGPLRARLLRGLARPGNEGSRSLELAAGGLSVLLTGDAEQEGLRALLRGPLGPPGAFGTHGAGGAWPWAAAAPGEPSTELLLAPHHGSDTPWLAMLLERLRPRQVWVSGPGSPPIAPELDRRGVPWRSTGRDGPLLLELVPPNHAGDARGPAGILRPG